MLEQCLNVRDRWGGVSDIIDRWLLERQSLISVFVALPQKQINDDVIPQIQAFCQVLVDYTSSGHFEVYEHLLKEAAEYDDGGLELAQQLYPNIQSTTDVILDFNDFVGGLESLNLQGIVHVSKRLSALGEALEERFELEDQLIERLHNVHRDNVQSEGHLANA